MRNKFLVIINLVIVEGWGQDKALRSKEGDASMPQLVLGFTGLRTNFGVKCYKNIHLHLNYAISYRLFFSLL